MSNKRLNELLFQGHRPLAYIKTAWKVLFAGFIGLLVGDAIQQIVTPMTGWPWAITYIVGALVGFIVNLRTQIRLGSVKVPD